MKIGPEEWHKINNFRRKLRPGETLNLRMGKFTVDGTPDNRAGRHRKAALQRQVDKLFPQEETTETLEIKEIPDETSTMAAPIDSVQDNEDPGSVSGRTSDNQGQQDAPLPGVEG